MDPRNGAVLTATDGKSDEDRAFESMMAERAARKKGGVDARAKALDRASLFALNQAEIDHGDDRVKRVVVAPLCIVVIGLPEPAYVKRWRQVSRSDRAKPADKMTASDDMGRSAVIWPTAENPCTVAGCAKDYDALCEAFPGLPESVAAEAVKLAGILDTEDVGK